jgi:NAD(P)H-nitrite reductase large subunit
LLKNGEFMIDLDTEICVCNGLSVQDIAECIKKNGFKSLEEILDNNICPMGDKCESCIDEGINNDGLNIPFVLSMVEKKMI